MRVKPRRAGPFRETELEACAFLVVNQLARLGLANIDDSFPGKTFRSKFRIHPLLRFQVARFLLPPR